MTAGIVTLLVFAACGVVIARRFKQPVALLTWVALVVGIVVASYVGTHTRLLSVFGFDVYLNRALQSLGIGIVVGLLIRMAMARRPRRMTA
jgi:hypothetical protein